MEACNKKNVHNILACVLRLTNNVPTVKNFKKSIGWSKTELAQLGVEELKKKIYQVLSKCDVQTICYIDSRGVLNSKWANEIAMKVLWDRNRSTDPLTNEIKKKYCKYF